MRFKPPIYITTAALIASLSAPSVSASEPLQVADPTKALQELPNVPSGDVAATPESSFAYDTGAPLETTSVGFFGVELDPQMGWNNTIIEINAPGLGVFAAGIVAGYILAIIRGKV